MNSLVASDYHLYLVVYWHRGFYLIRPMKDMFTRLRIIKHIILHDV